MDEAKPHNLTSIYSSVRKAYNNDIIEKNLSHCLCKPKI